MFIGLLNVTRLGGVLDPYPDPKAFAFSDLNPNMQILDPDQSQVFFSSN